jgi:hypothetical protein
MAAASRLPLEDHYTTVNIRNTDNTGSANSSADINSIEVSTVSTASSVLTKTVDERAQMILF